MTKRTVLHVGCGHQGIEALPPLDWEAGWRQVRLDIDPAVKPDIVASITDLTMIEDNSIDLVFSKHNIEHLEHHEALKALGEFHRVLGPTGFLVIRCPDLGEIARRLIKGDPEETCWISTLDDGTTVEVTLLDMIYGARGEIAAGARFMAHRTGFTRASMIRHLENAGFVEIDVKQPPKRLELFCRALKEKDGNCYYEVNDYLREKHRSST